MSVIAGLSLSEDSSGNIDIAWSNDEPVVYADGWCEGEPEGGSGAVVLERGNDFCWTTLSKAKAKRSPLCEMPATIVS